MLLVAIATLAEGAPENPGVPGSVWSALTGKEQKEVVQELVKDLIALRQGVTKSIEDSTKSSKTLAELLEDQRKEDATIKDLGYYGQKYSKEYAIKAAEYLANNGNSLLQAAEDLSNGNYHSTGKIVFTAGAQSLGQIVSDSLSELEYPQSKYVWDTLVANADSIRKVMIELAKGDTANAWTVLGEEAKEKGKTLGKQAVANALSWIFSEMTSANVGEAYVQLIEAEIAFIEFSKRWLAREYAEPCLKRYVETYMRHAGETNRYAAGPFETGSSQQQSAMAAAFDSFDECAILGGAASSFRELEAQITMAGLPRAQVYHRMLEAYRRQTTMPDAWLEQQRRRAAAKAETQVKQGIDFAQRNLLIVNQGFMGVLRIRLNQLAWEKLDDRQKEELHRQLADALVKARTLVTQAATERDHVVGLCKEFDQAREAARGILAEADRVQSALRLIELRLETLPRCAAGGGTVTNDLSTLEAAAKADANAFERLLNEMRNEVDLTCQAAETVSTADTKQASLKALDQATEHANAANDVIASAEATVARLGDHSAQVEGKGAAGLSSVPDSADRRTETLRDAEDEIVGLSAEASRVADEFAKAKHTMRSASTRAHNLSKSPGDKFRQAIALLEPFENAPGAMAGRDEALRLLTDAREGAEQAEQCAFVVKEAWDNGDTQSNIGFGARAWSRREVAFRPGPDDIKAKIGAAHQACPAPSGEARGDLGPTLAKIRQYYARAADQTVLFEIARQGAQKCVRDAVLAYNQNWLKKAPLPSLVGLSRDAAKARVAPLQLTLVDEPGDSAPDAARVGTVQSQRPAAGSEVRADTQVVVRLYGETAIDPEAVARTAAAAETALRACRFDEARAQLETLPADSPEAAKVRALLEAERRAREQLREAAARRQERDFDAAQQNLAAARAAAACRDTIAQIDQAAAEIEAAARAEVASQVAAARAAVQACEMRKAVELVRNLPKEHPERAALTSEIRRESEARKVYNDAKALFDAKDYPAALSRMEEGRAQAICPTTAASFDDAIAKTRRRIAEDEAEAARAAQAALDTCQMDEAAAQIRKLAADNPAKTGLAGRYRREVTAREAYGRGRAAFDAGDTDAALRHMNDARANAQCEETHAAIDRAVAAIEGKAADLAATRAREAEAAMQACDFDRARALIASLESGSAERNRLSELLAREREARAEARAAQDQLEAGRYDGAIAGFQAARPKAVCHLTVAAIDRAIGAVRERQAADAEALQAAARAGAFAVRGCRMQDAYAMLGRLPPGSPERERLAAMIESEEQAQSYFPRAQSAYDAQDYRGAWNWMQEARARAQCAETRTNADRNIAIIENTAREADRMAREEEQRRRDQEAREAAEAAAAIGSILGAIGQGLGGAGSATVPDQPPTPTYGGTGGTTQGGGANTACAGFQQEANAFNARTQSWVQAYTAAGRANDEGRLQYLACQHLADQRRFSERLRYYQSRGCPIPPEAFQHQGLINQSYASNCG